MFHWDLSIKKVLYQHTQGLQHHFPKKNSAEIGSHPMPVNLSVGIWFHPKKPGAGWAQYQNRVQLSIGAGLSPFLTKNHGLILMGFTLWLEENRPGDALHVFGTVKSNWSKKFKKNSLDIFSSTWIQWMTIIFPHGHICFWKTAIIDTKAIYLKGMVLYKLP